MPFRRTDEPELDALTRTYMQEELLGIVRGAGKTAILVTHDIDEALLLADRILVMSSRPGTIKHELRVPFGPDHACLRVSSRKSHARAFSGGSFMPPSLANARKSAS